jgi:membrane-bound lytic murein transglycosylase D
VPGVRRPAAAAITWTGILSKHMSVTGNPPRSLAIPPLSVRTEDGRTFRFTRPFQIGREQGCDVRIEDGHVSRKHVMVSFGNGLWRVRDQRSGNGLFVDGERIDAATVDSGLTIQLGADGPLVTMELEGRRLPAPAAPPPLPAAGGETRIYAEKYFGTATDDDAVGGRTMMIRKAYQQVQKKQKRTYQAIVAVVTVAALAAGGYAYHQRQELARQQAIANDLFYTMKSLDVDIANSERRLLASGGKEGQDLVKSYLARRRQMETNYDLFISNVKVYDHTLTPQEKLILRVTRLFGECETAAPPEYLAEVGNYIRTWQKTGSFAASVKRARDMGYAKRIAEEFQRQDLPAQFFYLAMVESGFDELASGPPTRFGIAKGMWQFIPETAQRYGLTVGPFVQARRPDPGDDRHKWEKATRAAAAYIKDIYSTDAQASGLLVMASYNWGENRVIKMLRTMPLNPRERNFWKVLEQHRQQVPPETYNYVMSIVSAAVIGENPKLFGFDFDSPLAIAEIP